MDNCISTLPDEFFNTNFCHYCAPAISNMKICSTFRLFIVSNCLFMLKEAASSQATTGNLDLVGEDEGYFCLPGHLILLTFSFFETFITVFPEPPLYL